MQTMKVTIKNLLTAFTVACIVPALNAQFDDVYYDPDNTITDYYDETYQQDDEYVTYYDDDEYEYYDDYDYYYSSRIKRFHRSYHGFGFYDPCYVSFNYYDPFYYDAYYYPGASIYISFGHSDYWSYRQFRNWQRWNRWNHYSHWDNWHYSPASYYYSYNSWCSPSYNYWGGYHGYYSYNNYYNNYYNSCPLPVSNYYGVTHGTITTVNNGSQRGSYYGPRISGNTGSSPRGTLVNPGNVQPVMKDRNQDATQSNDNPVNAGDGVTPNITKRPNPVTQQPNDDGVPANPPSVRDDQSPRDIPVDKELTRDQLNPVSKRPVFRPYPSGEDQEQNPGTEKTTDRPNYRPTEDQKPSSRPTDTYTPRPNNNRDTYRPSGNNDKPVYRPEPRNDERPRYSPPARNNGDNEKPAYNPRREERPNYSPPSRDESPNERRPSYTPQNRGNDSGRTSDRPSYTPSSRSNDSGRSHSPSSSGSPRNNGSGSSRSPRGN